MHYHDRPDDLPEETRNVPGDVPTRVADFVAGMTDGYAIRTHASITGAPIPRVWEDREDAD
jgi:dGTP triphosphohydrolase